MLLAATCQAATVKKPTEDVAVQYVEVTNAYQALKSTFPEIADIVRSIQIDKNSLTLNLGHAKIDEVRKLLAKIDVRPSQIYLEAVVSEIAKDGAEKILSLPTAYTREGQPMDIVLPLDNGKKMKVSVKASALPRVVTK